MTVMHDALEPKIPAMRERVAELVEQYGDTVISEVTVNQAYGGMRGVKGLVCDTSCVDPQDGVYIRGRPIKQLKDRLPEEVFFLLVTGDLPDNAQRAALQEELLERATVPQYVWNVIYQMPPEAHPMAMLSSALLVLERESHFKQQYEAGIDKAEQWRPALDDAVNLIAKVPIIAAGIYRIRFGKGMPIHPTVGQDWGGYYAEALGIDEVEGESEFANMVRLHLVLHSDHEGGNVSANTCNTVASALSDPYLAVSAGLNGLTGPLHGVANQEALRFVLEIHAHFGEAPTDEQLTRFIWDTLNADRVIPGYGHAVLRQTDPRFEALHELGERICADDPVFQIVDRMYQLVPDILKEQGKAKNPYPNVDAISGAMLYHFGIKEFSYYTVLFAVSRCMGMLSQLLMHRVLGSPIMRPKTVTTDWIEQMVKADRDAPTGVGSG